MVIGAGGYNTVVECRATRTPLLAVPQKRLYDRQQQRLHPTELVANVTEMLNRVDAFLNSTDLRANYRSSSDMRSSDGVDFPNGTHAALDILETLH